MEKRNIKALRIIRILLSKPDGSLTKYRIAKLAGCSAPWVIEHIRNLELKGIVKNTQVLNPDRLRDYYISMMPKIRHFEAYIPNPEKFLRESKMPYALTTYAAENHTAHHLFPSRWDVYISENDIPEWKKTLISNGPVGKGNVRIIPTYDQNILKEAETVEGLKIVLRPLLMIDLKKEGGVCMEAYSLMEKNV